MKKGFTLVELIIVIAVIGVLAAILIVTFADAIDKANERAAMSDAKNTFTKYIAEITDSQQTGVVDILCFVKKANKVYAFGFKNGKILVDSQSPYQIAKSFDATPYINKLLARNAITLVTEYDDLQSSMSDTLTQINVNQDNIAVYVCYIINEGVFTQGTVDNTASTNTPTTAPTAAPTTAPTAEPDKGYIMFSSSESFTVGLQGVSGDNHLNLEYKADESTWNTWDYVNDTIPANNKLCIRGTGNSTISKVGFNASFVLTGSNISCSGNIMNLLDYQTVINGDQVAMEESCFFRLFSDCTALVSAPTLPATTLSNGCYGHMFSGCTNLKDAPTLPATNLADFCYSDMFYDCISLTTAPVLPATTLTSKCYVSMFENCTNLIAAPALPATTLADECYINMFSGCTNLTAAPALPATELAFQCYWSMFNGCTSLKVSSTENSEYKYAWEVPAFSEEDNFCYSMFNETGGSFTGTPTSGRTYYFAVQPVG